MGVVPCTEITRRVLYHKPGCGSHPFSARSKSVPRMAPLSARHRGPFACFSPRRSSLTFQPQPDGPAVMRQLPQPAIGLAHHASPFLDFLRSEGPKLLGRL